MNLVKGTRTKLLATTLCAFLAATASPFASGSAELPLLDCVIEPHTVIELNSRVDGILEELLVERGDTIEPGQVVAKLDSGVEEAAVAYSEARAAMDAEILGGKESLAFGRRNQERIGKLYAKKAVSFHDIDKAETETKLAKFNLEKAQDKKRLAELELVQAKETLKLHTIRSPIRAVVVDRYLDTGESVEDRPIFKLAQIDPLRVEVIVPVDHFGQIESGQTASVYPEAPLTSEHRAVVNIVDPVVDAASGTFRVRLTMPNPNHALPSGLKCQVKFHSEVIEAKNEAIDSTTNPSTASETVPAVLTTAEHEVSQAAPSVCHSVGPLADRKQAEGLAEALAPYALRVASRAEQKKTVTQHLVIGMRTANREDALAIAARMQRQSIKGISLIRTGRLKGHLSLGVYPTPDDAEQRRSEVVARGFSANIVTVEKERRKQFWLDVAIKADERDESEISAIVESNYPGLPVAPLDCALIAHATQ